MIPCECGVPRRVPRVGGPWCRPAGAWSLSGGRVAVDRWWLRGGDAGEAERRVVRLLPGAVALARGEDAVDREAQRVVLAGHADPVRLLGEGLADHLQLLGHLRRVAEQDRVVGRDGVDLVGEQVVDADRVRVVRDEVGLRVVVLDALVRGRSGRRADAFAVEVGGPLDAVLVLAHEQALTGHVVGPGEADELLAVVVDRVRTDVVVDLAVLERGLAVGGGDRAEADPVRGEAESRRDHLRDLDVEAAVPAARRVLLAQVRLVLLGADDEPATRPGLAPRRRVGQPEAGVHAVARQFGGARAFRGGTAFLAAGGGEETEEREEEGGAPGVVAGLSGVVVRGPAGAAVRVRAGAVGRALARVVARVRDVGAGAGHEGVLSAQCLRILERKSLARSLSGAVKNSSGVRSSTMRPPSMKTTRSAADRAKPISCVTTTIVMPDSASCFMTSRTSLIISGSSAEVGSSKSRAFGSMARARAIATRCCWPPESWAGYLSAWGASPTRARSSRERRSASSRLRPRTLICASETFWSTVLCAKRLKDWKTMPTSVRSRARPRPSSGSGSPSSRMEPDWTVSSLLTVRQSVDLPDPEGPITTTTSPRCTVSETSWSTCNCP
ncbi:putative glutamate binding periplasmic protein [Streptomyces sp. Tu6071]|nr:putative glutamate binding periplasmic protein [Streptomyces sp. Tu6071]